MSAAKIALGDRCANIYRKRLAAGDSQESALQEAARVIGDAVESAHMALDDAVEEAVGEAEAAREEEDKLNEHYDANVRKFISDEEQAQTYSSFRQLYKEQLAAGASQEAALSKAAWDVT